MEDEDVMRDEGREQEAMEDRKKRNGKVMQFEVEKRRGKSVEKMKRVGKKRRRMWRCFETSKGRT